MAELMVATLIGWLPTSFVSGIPALGHNSMVNEDTNCLFRRGTRQTAKTLVTRSNGPAGAALALPLTLSMLRLQSMQDAHIALGT